MQSPARIVHRQVIALRLLARALKAGIEVEGPTHGNIIAQIEHMPIVAMGWISCTPRAGPIEEGLEVSERPDAAAGDEGRISRRQAEMGIERFQVGKFRQRPAIRARIVAVAKLLEPGSDGLKVHRPAACYVRHPDLVADRLARDRYASRYAERLGRGEIGIKEPRDPGTGVIHCRARSRAALVA